MTGDVADLVGLMGSSVVVANPTTAAKTLFGVETYPAAGSTYAAHIGEVSAAVRALPGIGEAATSVAWIASTSTGNIKRTSRVRLPDGTSPPVLSVSYPRDEHGNVHHTKVVFG